MKCLLLYNLDVMLLLTNKPLAVVIFCRNVLILITVVY